MRIEWNIIKKRGNLRPVLSYTVSLEEHEKQLAVPSVSILSAIPKPEEDWQDYCYPGQYERAGQPGEEQSGFHTLEAPPHKGQSWTRTLRLPWRQDNEYPEVEASFIQLRLVLEKELAAAHASPPLQTTGSLQTSAPAKREIAPGVLAERFLKVAAGKVN